MARSVDIAALILSRRPDQHVDTYTVQKLVYYVQAWSLVWLGKPAFEDPIQAWRNGPVSPPLFTAHQGRFQITAAELPGDTAAVPHDVALVLDAVLSAYGELSGAELSNLTHREDPWRRARAEDGVALGQASNAEISHRSMFDFYRRAGLHPFEFSAAYRRGIKLLASMPNDLAERFISDAGDETFEADDHLSWLVGDGRPR